MRGSVHSNLIAFLAAAAASWPAAARAAEPSPSASSPATPSQSAPSPATPSQAAQLITAKGLEWITSATPPADVPIAAGATAVSLDRLTKSGAAVLAGRLAGARLLATAVYDGKPTNIASDLSQQLKLVEDIPAEKLQPLLVDSSRSARADAVARDWAVDLLGAQETDIITAAVFWFADERNHSLLDGVSAEPHLMLVLIRSSRNAAGTPEIARIAWGPVGESK